MIYEKTTSLDAAEIFARARQFFAERVPQQAAYPEKSGESWIVFRGQGGEEITIAVFPDGSAFRIRASTLFFDQPLDRFLSTLPEAEVPA
ncbi:MAG TPA: hypothetical protein VFL88_13595 [Gemmatimonadales bacterium]|jgi:hypothetical protein|nr:hypothetical protein [Gemmatimonadales bacterium]